ncbi:T9SS type A sorting domain-containing protein [bacterium]|nr:T9SS type A sorting domain-containing protein [bacterium]
MLNYRVRFVFSLVIFIFCSFAYSNPVTHTPDLSVLNSNSLTDPIAISYFRIYIDGIEAYTQVQGQMQTFVMDCGLTGFVNTTFFVDLDSNAILDSVDYQLFEANFIDNGGEFPADSDPTAGFIRIDLPVSFPANHYIVSATDSINTVTLTYTVRAPESLTMSGSGRLTLEGVTPPDPVLEGLTLAVLVWDPILAVMFITDEYGDFYFNWVGPEGDLALAWLYTSDLDDYYYYELGYDINEHLPSWHIDGHVTDLEVFIPFIVPDTGYYYGYIQDADSNPVNADSLIKLCIQRSEPCGTNETLYIDVVDGNFSEAISMERCDLIEGYYEYYKIPPEYMQCERFGFLNFTESTLSHEFNEVLFNKNDTIWFQYSFYPGTPPIIADLPIKLINYGYGFTNAVIPPDTIVPVGIYAETFFAPYNVQIDCDTYLPETYLIWFNYDTIGRVPMILPKDTVNLVIRETESVIAGTLFSSSGGTASESGLLTYYYMPGFPTDLDITDGLYEINSFSGVLYYFEPRFNDYMTKSTQTVFSRSGFNLFNITLYPLNASFSLFLHTDDLAPETEELKTLVTYLTTGDYHFHMVRTNEWVEVPIYNGFAEACLFQVGYEDWNAVFDRFVENNGYIPVNPGDSIYIEVVSAVDHYTVRWERDMEDLFGAEGSWAATNHYIFNYYDPEDSTIAYTYDPKGAGSFIPCLISGYPIFRDTFNVRIEPAFTYAEEHGWLANPEGFLVGMDITPDTVNVYYNYACYHLWVHLDGFPAHYLDSPTLPISVTGVEEPEHPEHHFVTKFLLADEGEGNLFGYHQLCDAVWTIQLPDTLPLGFIPAVTETSIVVEEPEIFDWPHNHIRIEALWPPGIHGVIIKDSLSDPPLQTPRLYMQLYYSGTEDLYTEIQAFRYLDDITYISPLIEPGDYTAKLTCRGYPDAVFRYPLEFNFSYAGGDYVIPLHYTGRAYGEVQINFHGISAEAISGLSLTAYTTDEDHWFDVIADYQIHDTLMNIDLCEGEWVFIPPSVPGYSLTPVDTFIEVLDLVRFFELNFNYSILEDTLSGIDCRLERDEDDPSPVNYTDFYATLYLSDGITPTREQYVDAYGSFGFMFLPSDTYFIGVEYRGTGEAFIYEDYSGFELEPGEILELPPIYVDNAHVLTIINFEGIQAADVNCESILASCDLSVLPDTLAFAYTPFQIADTFYLCDGSWTFYAPVFDTFVFVPPETNIVIHETDEFVTINFRNTTHIMDKEPLPQNLSLETYPNPFNSRLNITVTSTPNANTMIEILNIRGEEVQSFAEIANKTGKYNFSWNGIDNKGYPIVSGIYFVRIKSCDRIMIRKILCLK